MVKRLARVMVRHAHHDNEHALVTLSLPTGQAGLPKGDLDNVLYCSWFGKLTMKGL